MHILLNPIWMKITKLVMTTYLSDLVIAKIVLHPFQTRVVRRKRRKGRKRRKLRKRGKIIAIQ